MISSQKDVFLPITPEGLFEGIKDAQKRYEDIVSSNDHATIDKSDKKKPTS